MPETWTPERVEAALEGLSTSIDGPGRDLVGLATASGELIPPPGWSRRPALGWAAVLVLLVVLATVAIAPARQAVADWLGIGATRVTVGSAPVPPVGVSLSDVLGAPIDPILADDAVGFSVAQLSRLRTGGPPAYHAACISGDLVAVLVYADSDQLPAIDDRGVGLVLSQREVEDAALATKTGAIAALESTTVDGRPALWLGGPHLLETGPQRLRAANVLLWVSQGIEYRLESGLDVAEAVTVAETIHR